MKQPAKIDTDTAAKLKDRLSHILSQDRIGFLEYAEGAYGRQIVSYIEDRGAPSHGWLYISEAEKPYELVEWPLAMARLTRGVSLRMILNAADFAEWARKVLRGEGFSVDY